MACAATLPPATMTVPSSAEAQPLPQNSEPEESKEVVPDPEADPQMPDLPEAATRKNQEEEATAKRGLHDGFFQLRIRRRVGRRFAEVHRRHHISLSGYYRGKKVVQTKSDE